MNAICHLRPFCLRSQLYLDRVIEAACYDIGQALLFQTIEYLTAEEATVHAHQSHLLALKPIQRVVEKRQIVRRG